MKKRRILLALIMLIISGISLTTATYAWFTANQKVTVEQVDVKATASGGIQISADAANWSNEVSLEQLKAVGTNKIPDTAAQPVSTIGVNGTTGQFDFFLGTLDDAGSQVNLAAEAEGNGNVVAFDLYFYTATAKTMRFDATTAVTAKNAENDKNLKYSMRIGFLYQGNTPTSVAATAIALKNGTSANQKIWEPYADVHTDYATNQLSANGVMPTMGAKAATAPDTYVAMNNDTYFKSITATEGLVTTNNGVNYPTSVTWSLSPGISKIKVYIWIEGQDIDCEDTASLGAGFSTTLGFTIAA